MSQLVLSRQYLCSYSLPSSSGVVSDKLTSGITMTTRSQLQEVQRKIADITAEMRKVQSALTAIQDTEHIDFLRNKHGRLHKERVAFCQQETILLQGQASGEHCLPR